MKHAYDQTRAKQLIPLLQSITAEVAERTRSVRRLERKLRAFGEDKDSAEALNLRAELAEQRRELRHARTELEELGCTADDSDPRRVLIPGIRGEIDSGFRWDLGDTNVFKVGESAPSAA